MKIKITLQLILLLLVQIIFAQKESIHQIRGRILADSAGVDRVNIVNVTTQKATISDVSGTFSIPAKADDILEFTAVNLETLRKKIDQNGILQEVLIIHMTAKSIILKEVVVNESSISAESIGVIPYGQKKYTPAERKLYTATSGGGID